MGGVLDDLWRKFSYKPPGPFYNLRDLQKTQANQNFRAKIVEQIKNTIPRLLNFERNWFVGLFFLMIA